MARYISGLRRIRDMIELPGSNKGELILLPVVTLVFHFEIDNKSKTPPNDQK